MSSSILSSLTGLLTVVFLLLPGSHGLFDFQTPRCDLPSIDHSSQLIDVLGDSEKMAVCRQPRPEDLCPNVGPADEACKNIARAVGGVRNVSCSHPNTCAFLVKAPIQSPNTPGYAYVSLCTPEFIGVIFPCRENKLVISNPFWKGVYHSDEASAITTNFGNVGSNPLCAFPRLDSIDPGIDVLGDLEKARICSLPRPSQLCSKGRGAADEACKSIASVAGDTSNPRCLRKRTCGFHVKRPVQHPNEPGDAYVSLCKTEYDGVIFPCRENNLHIVDPFYNEDIFGTVDEPSEPPPNWIEDSSSSTGSILSSTSLPGMNKTKTPPKNKPKPKESDKNKGSQLFSKYIAHKLAKMDPIQARYAERLISEIIFQGDSNTLNKNVKLVELPEADLANPLPLHPARVGYASRDGHSFKIMDTPDEVRQQQSNTVKFISE